MKTFVGLMIGGIFFALAGCTTAPLAAPASSTPRPSSTITDTVTPTVTPSATPIPSPSVTFPPPLAFQGTVPAGLAMRFGQGSFDNMAISPDGNYLAVVSGVGIILYRPETLTEVRILSRQTVSSKIFWSPDSKRLLAAELGGLVIWEVEKARSLQTLKIPGMIADIHWTSDGKILALVQHNETIEVWDLKLAKRISRFSGPGETTKLQWVADNKIVSANGYKQAILWEASTGKILHVWQRSQDGFDIWFALSPDKQTLAIGLKPGELLLWNIASAQEHKVEIGFPRFFTEAAWSADGKTLAFLTMFPSKLIFVDIGS